MKKLVLLARPALANTLLALASILIFYIAMEYAIFRLYLPLAPLDIQTRIPELADVLTQTTKSTHLPHDYVALLGDSYAEGVGDWLLAAGSKWNGPFHSADVIRRLTGHDVASFGMRGAGSAEEMVLRPADALPTSRCSIFPEIEVPQQMFIYFYEGNDMEDNVRFLDRVTRAYGRSDNDAIDRYLAGNYAANSLLRCHGQLADMTFKLVEFLSQYYITGYSVPQCGSSVPSRNHLVVGDNTIEAPSLQGPAPHFSDQDIARAMGVFARSLAWLRRRFDAMPITVVYIPAPLSVYHHATDMVSFCSTTGAGLIAADVISRHHDLMRDTIAKMSAAERVDFVDATPVLRSAAETSVIHGPRDWDHLNRLGYEVLGKLVAAQVKDEPED